MIASEKDVEFSMYFPEIHLLNAINARKDSESFSIGCQGVYEEDSSVGGNFGAFTSHRTGNSMRQAGVDSVIIGHLEERLGLKNILREGSVSDFSSVNRILNKRVKKAVESGLKVLFCIGETLEERDNWKEVLKEAIEVGLDGIGRDNVIIAYEPAWAIGPGKVPPTSQEIKEIVDYIKTIDKDLEVLYGGGLKKDKAKDLTKIDSLVGYQSSFVDALGKEGDTMKAAYDAMNKYTDKTIANISGMPEYSDGAEFNKSVVQILNNLKTTNASSGKNMMELYEKSNAGEEITDADFNRMDKLADEYDKTWEQELKNFDAAQKKYAEKAGITIQQVGKIVN